VINSIEISNFRGFEKLQLGRFSHVNIFMGHNGVGKTTALEAIALSEVPAGIDMLIKLALWRDFPHPAAGAADGLRFLFPPGKEKAGCTISVETADGSRTVRFTPKYEGYSLVPGGNASTTSSEIPVSADAGGNLRGIDIEVRNKKGVFNGELILHQTGAQWQWKSPSPGDSKVFFIQARRANSINETAEVLTQIAEQRRTDEFVSVLRIIEPRLRNIAVGARNNQPVVQVDIGEERTLPLNVLGDGFCRAVLIASGILSGCSAIVIDEIDSGLHHSVMFDFWKALNLLCRQTQVQLFCATHSDEMIQAAIRAFDSDPARIRACRLERQQNGRISAVLLEHAELASLNHLGLEAR
jgi:energy-coupling factor transporter ATP-binding protein EcfA2